MADEAELLAAIVRAPHDDVARLVYADWLSDQSDPRGELIQLQVSQARLHAGTAAFSRIRDRVSRLLNAHFDAWQPRVRVSPPGSAFSAPPPGPPPGPHPDDYSYDWEFLRGFPERLQTVPQALIAFAPALFAAAPLLWDVRLDCRSLRAADPLGWVEQLAPKLAGVRHLGLTGVNESSLIALAGRPELTALRGLTLKDGPMGAAALESIASRHSSLLSLERLELSQLRLSDPTMGRLFSGGFRALKELAIHHEPLGPRTSAALSELPSAPAKVDLSWCTLSGTALETLLSGRLLEQVEELNLSYLSAGDALAPWLHAAPPTLKVLRLTHARPTPAVLAALREADRLEQLELLDLSQVALDDSTSAALLARFGEKVLFRSES